MVKVNTGPFAISEKDGCDIDLKEMLQQRFELSHKLLQNLPCMAIPVTLLSNASANLATRIQNKFRIVGKYQSV